jgi:hypothetical protein
VFRTIITAWLVSGALDISDALIFYGFRGVAAERLLQNIASALIGPAAFTGGWPAAMLGLALHFLIAFVASALFVLAAERLKFLTRHPWSWGLIYGAVVYLFMNFVVLPLAGKTGGGTGIALFNGVLAIVLLVGLPVSLISSRRSV